MAVMPVDRTAWKWREYFEQYHLAVPCAHSPTVQTDATSLPVPFVTVWPLRKRSIHMKNSEWHSTAMLISTSMVFFIRAIRFSWWIRKRFNQMDWICKWLWSLYEVVEQDRKLYGKRESLEDRPHTPQNCFNVSIDLLGIPWGGQSESCQGEWLRLPHFYPWPIPWTQSAFLSVFDNTG